MQKSMRMRQIRYVQILRIQMDVVWHNNTPVCKGDWFPFGDNPIQYIS